MSTERQPIMDPTNFPSDPRDCCRKAQKVMISGAFEWDKMALPYAALMLAEAMARQMRDGVAISDAEPLEAVIMLAERALDQQRKAYERIRALVRHGTMDHREIDQRLAAQKAEDAAILGE